MTSALLYMDMLGVRAAWEAEGRSGAERAFERFRRFFHETIADFETGDILDGGLESDSVALVCGSTTTAVAIGVAMYLHSFKAAVEESDERVWIRGAVVAADGEPLRTARALAPPLDTIETYDYGGSMLDAISVERSGFRGMRLVVDPELVTINVQDAFRVEINGNIVERFLQLTYARYPKRLQDSGYYDVLWMAEPSDWTILKERMADRLQWAAKNSEEFAQAAETQVIFYECSSVAD